MTIPDWFWQAVDQEGTQHTVEVDDCDVAYQRWGDAGKPPVLLIHGMNAHSHWWDFIAPQLLDDWQVAAMDLTGMGDSDYRYSYESSTYADEIKAVCDDAGFGNDVILVAHSFGGNMSVKAVNQHPQRFGGLILVDSGIRHPDEPEPDRPTMGGRAKVYPDKQTALGRFRLQPPQPCENEYILQYIARHSLLPIDGGYTWKFDEDLLHALKGAEREAQDYRDIRLPFGVIYGADSELFSAKNLEYLQELVPQDFPSARIEGAQHHVFLDKPLEFVAALREMLVALRPA